MTVRTYPISLYGEKFQNAALALNKSDKMSEQEMFLVAVQTCPLPKGFYVAVISGAIEDSSQ